MHTMKSDKELLEHLTAHLKSLPDCRAEITLHVSVDGFDSPEEIGRVVELAEAKCFIEKVRLGVGRQDANVTFLLTTRGAEAMGLD